MIVWLHGLIEASLIYIVSIHTQTQIYRKSFYFFIFSDLHFHLLQA